VSNGGLSPLPREARLYQGRRAGVATRLAASTIDGLVVGLFLGVVYAGLAGFLFLLNPRSFSFPNASWLFSLTSAFVVVVVYLSFLWWSTGRTYGCLVMGLRVVDSDGQRLRLPRAILRAGLCAIFPIGLLWCAVNRNSSSVQDLILHSAVIYDWQPQRVGHHAGNNAEDGAGRGADHGAANGADRGTDHRADHRSETDPHPTA
jgi:uncharacterized RDD family membrane protein YckC